jgi:hypothetical protein
MSMIAAMLYRSCFDAADDAFVSHLRTMDRLEHLKRFAKTWYRDPRPWARAQLFRYFDQPLDCPGHHALVKALLRLAESERDHELMGALMVAFDRSVRRRRFRQLVRYGVARNTLYAPRDRIVAQRERRYRDSFTGREYRTPRHPPKNGKLFTLHTRYYLRRRAWRYFRWLGYREPQVYLSAVVKALTRYRDEDFELGENILDNWGLVHACFGESDLLRFGTSTIDLARGARIAQLTAAPAFSETWQSRAAVGKLLDLLQLARAHFVRRFAVTVLSVHHGASLGDISVARWLMLVEHRDAYVAGQAMKWLEGSRALDSLPIDSWVELLSSQNLTVVDSLCQLVRSRVRPERFSIEQLLALCKRDHASVASLGLQLLSSQIGQCDLSQLVGLAHASCEAIGERLTDLAFPAVLRHEQASVDDVCAFFDSLNTAVRQRAWVWLTERTRAYHDNQLWVRLFESPFDDVRMTLVDVLEHRALGLSKGSLSAFFSSVLLAIHRGGHKKTQAIKQLRARLSADPALAESLFPLLCLAARSIRGPEFRAALAAIVRLSLANPEHAARAKQLLPELTIAPHATDELQP